MPRRSFTNRYALDVLAQRQHSVVAYRQLKELGLPPSTLSYLIRTGGPWQRVLPGVHFTFSGDPSLTHMLQAGLLYVGDGAVITGMTALRLYGFIDAADTQEVHILVPHDRRRSSRRFVRVERTIRIPAPHMVNGFACAPIARAVADAARFVRRKATVRAIVAEAVHGHGCTTADLFAELREGPRRGSALLREVVIEIHEGIRSAGEGDVRDFFRRNQLPEPLWNVGLYAPGGEFIALVDGLLEKWLIVIEFNSMRYHRAYLDWEWTQERQALIASYQLLTVPITSRRMRADEIGLVADVRRTIDLAESRPLPNVVIGPPPPPGQLRRLHSEAR